MTGGAAELSGPLSRHSTVGGSSDKVPPLIERWGIGILWPRSRGSRLTRERYPKYGF